MLKQQVNFTEEVLYSITGAQNGISSTCFSTQFTIAVMFTGSGNSSNDRQTIHSR